MDFARQAEAVLRLHNILENKKQQRQIQDKITQRMRALEENHRPEDMSSHLLLAQMAGGSNS